MATPPIRPTTTLNGDEKNYYNNCYSRGGIAVLDQVYPELANGVILGGTVAGQIVLEGRDGVPIVIPIAQPGAIYNIKHRRVLSTATINSIVYNTIAATTIAWLGGCD